MKLLVAYREKTLFRRRDLLLVLENAMWHLNRIYVDFVGRVIWAIMYVVEMTVCGTGCQHFFEDAIISRFFTSFWPVYWFLLDRFFQMITS